MFTPSVSVNPSVDAIGSVQNPFDTDADAWWCNLKQCSLFLSSVNMRVNGKVNADARCEWTLSSIPCLYFSLVERML